MHIWNVLAVFGVEIGLNATSVLSLRLFDGLYTVDSVQVVKPRIVGS